VCLNFQLTRRFRELEAELERREGHGGEPRRDSHNSSLPPVLDLPGVKAQNAVRRTRSLRRRTGRRVGGQTGHLGAPLNVIRGEVVICLSMLFAPEPEIYNMI